MPRGLNLALGMPTSAFWKLLLGIKLRCVSSQSFESFFTAFIEDFLTVALFVCPGFNERKEPRKSLCTSYQFEFFD